MSKYVEVRGVKIGEGVPKICVPIVGKTKEEILAAAKSFENVKKDVVEFRVDWFEGVFDFAPILFFPLSFYSYLMFNTSFICSIGISFPVQSLNAAAPWNNIIPRPFIVLHPTSFAIERIFVSSGE